MYLLRRNELLRGSPQHLYRNLPIGTPQLVRMVLASERPYNSPEVPSIELKPLLESMAPTPSNPDYPLVKTPGEAEAAATSEHYSYRNLMASYTSSVRSYLMGTYGHINEHVLFFFKERLHIHEVLRKRPEQLFDILAALPAAFTKTLPKTS